MVSRQLFDGQTPPSLGNLDSTLTVGTTFLTTVPNRFITAILYWQPTTDALSTAKTCAVWKTPNASSEGPKLVEVTHTPVGVGWQRCVLPEPIPMDVDPQLYLAGVCYPGGGYPATPAFYSSSAPSPVGDGLYAQGPGQYTYGTSIVYPSASVNFSNYWVDVNIADEADLEPAGPLVQRRSGASWVTAGFVKRRENGVWVPATVTKN
jgi:hypothetical protein